MFQRISYTLELMGASWQILKRDKELILFPLLSAICCILVVISFVAPLFVIDIHAVTGLPGHPTPAQKMLGWAYLFLFYFMNYFVITFFNVGIVACATSRMAGGEPTFTGGLREATKRAHLIAAWALVSATVGVVLKLIESRNKKIGRIIADIIGVAWSIATFLVVPVLVVEDMGPIQAVKRSISVLSETWGERIVGAFSFGLIFGLLFIPALVAIGFGAYLAAVVSSSLGMTVIALAVLYLILLALVHSALQSIFQAAVYMHTQGIHDATGTFPVQMLRTAYAQD